MSTLKVFRFDPSIDSEPYYREYEVPVTPGMSVLQGLHYIRENIESISYEYSCRATSCGLCGMAVNGTPCFACCTPLEEGKKYTINPLDRYPVVKDLIIDRSAIDERINSIMPQFSRSSTMIMPAKMSAESNLSTSMLQQCRDCGICMSVCPTLEMQGFDSYAGPQVLVKLAARYFDDREGSSNMRLKQAVNEGLFNCIECGTCTSVCPKGELMKVKDLPYSFIDHVSYFKKMKAAAEAADMKPTEEDPAKALTTADYVITPI